MPSAAAVASLPFWTFATFWVWTISVAQVVLLHRVSGFRGCICTSRITLVHMATTRASMLIRVLGSLGIYPHFCDTRELLGGPCCCVTEVDSVSHRTSAGKRV